MTPGRKGNECLTARAFLLFLLVLRSDREDVWLPVEGFEVLRGFLHTEQIG